MLYFTTVMDSPATLLYYLPVFPVDSSYLGIVSVNYGSLPEKLGRVVGEFMKLSLYFIPGSFHTGHQQGCQKNSTQGKLEGLSRLGLHQHCLLLRGRIKGPKP